VWWLLACWTANWEVCGSNPGQGRNLVQHFSAVPLAKSFMTSTLICQWEDETEGELATHICWG